MFVSPGESCSGVGTAKAWADGVCRQASWNLLWGKSEETVHCHRIAGQTSPRYAGEWVGQRNNSTVVL